MQGDTNLREEQRQAKLKFLAFLVVLVFKNTFVLI